MGQTTKRRRDSRFRCYLRCVHEGGSRSCDGDREGNLAESARFEWGQAVNRNRESRPPRDSTRFMIHDLAPQQAPNTRVKDKVRRHHARRRQPGRQLDRDCGDGCQIDATRHLMNTADGRTAQSSRRSDTVRCRFLVPVRTLLRQLSRQVPRRHIPATAGILPRPERREVVPALLLRPRAQRCDRLERQRELRNVWPQGTEFPNHAIHDATGRTPGEEIGDGCVPRILTGQRGSVDGTGPRFRTQQVGRADLRRNGAKFERCPDTSRVGDATGREDRHRNGAYDLRHECESHRAALTSRSRESSLGARQPRDPGQRSRRHRALRASALRQPSSPTRGWLRLTLLLSGGAAPLAGRNESSRRPA